MSSINLNKLKPGKSYVVKVRAYDAEGNYSAYSLNYVFTVPSANTDGSPLTASNTSVVTMLANSGGILAGPFNAQGITDSASVNFSNLWNGTASVGGTSGSGGIIINEQGIIGYKFGDSSSSAAKFFLDTHDGNAYFRGAITATTASIGGTNGIIYDGNTVTIGTGVVINAGVTASSLSINADNYWLNSGSFNVGDATSFMNWNPITQQLTISGSNVSLGSDVTILGIVTASSVIVGASPNYLTIANNADGAGNPGMYINPNNYWMSTGSFSLGSSAQKVLWNNSSLNITGTINALQGSIGSGSVIWNIGNNTVSGAGIIQSYSASVTPAITGRLVSGSAGQDYVTVDDLTGIVPGMSIYSLGTAQNHFTGVATYYPIIVDSIIAASNRLVLSSIVGYTNDATFTNSSATFFYGPGISLDSSGFLSVYSRAIVSGFPGQYTDTSVSLGPVAILTGEKISSGISLMQYSEPQDGANYYDHPGGMVVRANNLIGGALNPMSVPSDPLNPAFNYEALHIVGLNKLGTNDNERGYIFLDPQGAWGIGSDLNGGYGGESSFGTIKTTTMRTHLPYASTTYTAGVTDPGFYAFDWNAANNGQIILYNGNIDITGDYLVNGSPISGGSTSSATSTSLGTVYGETYKEFLTGIYQNQAYAYNLNNITSGTGSGVKYTSACSNFHGTTDSGYWELTLPFSSSIAGETFNKIYVYTNSYLTISSSVNPTTASIGYLTFGVPVTGIEVDAGNRSASTIYLYSSSNMWEVRYEGWSASNRTGTRIYWQASSSATTATDVRVDIQSVTTTASNNPNATGIFNGLGTQIHPLGTSSGTSYGEELIFIEQSPQNTALGASALNQYQISNLALQQSTAVGYQALANQIGGYNNDAFGYNAMYSNANGFRNLAIGGQALEGNLNGSYNTMVGSLAGFGIEGSENTAIGYTAMYLSPDAYQNVAIGMQALGSNISASNNVAIGSNSMWNATGTAFKNVVVGDLTLANASVSNYNTAVGAESLAFAFSSRYNTSIGYQSMNNGGVADSGSYNVALGVRAGAGLTSGSANVIIGGYDAFTLTTGAYSNRLILADGVGNLFMSASYHASSGLRRVSFPGTASMVGNIFAASNVLITTSANVGNINVGNFTASGNVSFSAGSLDPTDLSASTVTIGSTAISLGGTSTTLTGLTTLTTSGRITASSIQTGIVSSSLNIFATSSVNAGNINVGNFTASGNLTFPPASIDPTNLTASTVNIGSTAISLGQTQTTLTGLTSVTSNSFTTGAITNGTVTASGRVTSSAIQTGTVSASANLAIGGTASISGSTVFGYGITGSAGELLITRTNSASEGGNIVFANAVDNSTGWNIDSYGGSASPDLRFFINGVTRQTINGVTGNVYITNTASVGGNVVYHIATNAQAPGSGSYTLVIGDDGKVVELSSTTANTLVVPGEGVAFPVGTQITLLSTNTGQTTVSGSSGVTVNATPGTRLRAQWSGATLIKRAASTWVLFGDLSA